jgi:hypothetical protein
MVKIAFYEEKLSVRGTTVALYDYANANESVLGNQSIIIMSKKGFESSDNRGILRLISRFRLLTYNTQEQMEKILEKEKCDILYCIKYGTREKDPTVSKKVKTVIHCVFDMTDPHGNVYAGVSEALAKKFNSNCFVPHMIGLEPSKTKENLREELKIPDDAIVYGRYGGQDTFDIPWCWEVIRRTVEQRKDVYFLFINTPHIIEHERIFYLPVITDNEDKNRFINTCDAYLECGSLGHSFGLAIGEFSVNNKPIIAYVSNNMWNIAHIKILGNRALYFRTAEEFYIILNSLNPNVIKNYDFNCYRDYSPEKVMEQFKKVFIE